MPAPSALDACSVDLFTDADELHRKYPDHLVEKIIRIREMYNWMLANPSATDREYVDETAGRHGISKVTAYADLAVCKALLPRLAENAREFHRWRYTEMILDTFNMARARKDTKTMERAATSYARYTRIDVEDEKKLPYDMIVVQPFTATDDPSVLGIKPIPNLRQRIDHLLDKYRKESADIEDIEAEEIDLEFPELFPPEDEHSVDGR